MTNHRLHTDTALVQGLKQLFQQLEERLNLKKPLVAYLAGGMAVHLYTATRVTSDVDAEFSEEIRKRAEEALGGFVGDERMLRLNLHDAIEIARNAEAGIAAVAPPATDRPQ